jgi:hypothetical protein
MKSSWMLLCVLAGCSSRPLYWSEAADAAPTGDMAQPASDFGDPPDAGAPPDQGSCGFRALAPYERPQEQRFSAAADFDGDGHADLLTSDSGQMAPRRLALRLGRGDGSFAEPRFTPQPALEEVDLAAGDFDSDGKSDVVVARMKAIGAYSTTGGGMIEVWRGQKQGALVRSHQVVLGDQFPYGPRAVAAVRIDGDASLDVLELDQGVLLSRLGRGDGTFEAPVETLLHVPGEWPFAFMMLASGDFDRDGHLDAVVATRTNQLSQTLVRVFLGDGKGGFVHGFEIVAPFYARSLAAVDVAGDGRLDLVADGDALNVLAGKGDGTFTVTPPIVDPLQGISRWFDLDGDGVPERISISLSRLQVRRRLANGGYDETRTTLPSWTYLASLAIADFNEDGKPDVAASGSGSMIAFADGHGGFKFGPQMGTSHPVSVGVGDFDGDGVLDVVGASMVEEILTLRRGRGDGTLGDPEDTHLFRNPFNGFTGGQLITRDFNGDGALDVMVMGRYNVTSLYLGDGAGHFAREDVIPVSAHRGQSIDLDGDGRLDLVGDGRIAYLARPQGGYAAHTIDATALAGSDGQRFQLADFNGDKRPDLAMVLAGEVRVFPGRGDGSFDEAPMFASSGGYGWILAAVDVDGDGHQDVIALKANEVAVLRGHGDGSFAVPQLQTANSRDGLAVADFDGDGTLDLMAAGGDGVDWLRGLGKGSFAPAQRYAAGALIEGLVAGDLDGDGYPDVVGFNYWTNSWTVLHNELQGCP